MEAVAELDTRLTTFIEQHAQDTFYYHRAWLALISRLYGYTTIALTTTGSDGQYTGFLPLSFLQSPLTGRRLVALPFSDHAPLLATDEASAGELVERAIRLAQERKAKYLELRTGLHPVLAAHPGLMESNLYVNWLLPLAADPQVVWSGLRKPVQRQIKKSQGHGVKVRFAQNLADIQHFYHLHLQTRGKKHGMPAQPLLFFSELWKTFAPGGTMQLLLAEYEGKIIASMILLASGSTLRYAYGASDEGYLHLSPNNLLMWEAITWGCTHGYQRFDLGRTSCDNEGLMEFKRRWGATQQPLPYYYYPRTTGLAATSEKSWKFRLLTGCWKRLPLQIAGPLGGRLYKHLG